MTLNSLLTEVCILQTFKNHYTNKKYIPIMVSNSEDDKFCDILGTIILCKGTFDCAVGTSVSSLIFAITIFWGVDVQNWSDTMYNNILKLKQYMKF